MVRIVGALFLSYLVSTQAESHSSSMADSIVSSRHLEASQECVDSTAQLFNDTALEEPANQLANDWTLLAESCAEEFNRTTADARSALVCNIDSSDLNTNPAYKVACSTNGVLYEVDFQVRCDYDYGLIEDVYTWTIIGIPFCTAQACDCDDIKSQAVDQLNVYLDIWADAQDDDFTDVECGTITTIKDTDGNEICQKAGTTERSLWFLTLTTVAVGSYLFM